jgi:mycothiol synthase
VPASISTPQSLNASDSRQIRRLAAEFEGRHGAPPLSDQALSQLSATDVTHLLARAGQEIVGYAQLDGESAEVLAEQEAADGLLDLIEARTPTLELWAHGRRSPLLEVAERRGYGRARVLWQLRWHASELPPPTLAGGVVLRSFVPGQDEQEWLRVNAAAFTHHPEQGGWSIDDIRAREAEPWFDPLGFLLAERDDVLIGFHWTKEHNPRLGEVYVLGVSPQAQGLHLGSALLIAGLNWLTERGVEDVLLYVDDDNIVAMRLYERYGFAKYDQDVQYRHQLGNGTAGGC